MRAFLLFLLKLALYARRGSNPQALAPEANDVRFMSCCFNCTYANFKKSWVRFGCESVFQNRPISARIDNNQAGLLHNPNRFAG